MTDSLKLSTLTPTLTQQNIMDYDIKLWILVLLTSWPLMLNKIATSPISSY